MCFLHIPGTVCLILVLWLVATEPVPASGTVEESFADWLLIMCDASEMARAAAGLLCASLALERRRRFVHTYLATLPSMLQPDPRHTLAGQH